jgi:SAM-dependent methyltransferase
MGGMPPTLDFGSYDRRGYRTVDARSGYGAWAATYEQTVAEKLDIDMLEALGAVAWADAGAVVDLACGTGRTGAWLAQRSPAAIDGVDITAEMLALARDKGVYRSLTQGDVTTTGLPDGGYDLAMASLVDEHLADLHPFYAEAFRLLRPGGAFVLVGLHPQFLMASGMPTHFDGASGEPVAIETHVHLLSEHAAAALGAGFALAEMREQVIDDAWLEAKPRWEPQRGQPISFALVWRR